PLNLPVTPGFRSAFGRFSTAELTIPIHSVEKRPERWTSRKFSAISNACAKLKSNGSLKEKNDFWYQILADGIRRRYATRHDTFGLDEDRNHTESRAAQRDVASSPQPLLTGR